MEVRWHANFAGRIQPQERVHQFAKAIIEGVKKTEGRTEPRRERERERERERDEHTGYTRGREKEFQSSKAKEVGLTRLEL
jgi:hypothetical protein